MVNSVESKISQKGKRKALFETEEEQDNKRRYRKCFRCGKKGHYVKEYRLLKKEKEASDSHANVVENVDLVAMVKGGVESLSVRDRNQSLVDEPRLCCQSVISSSVGLLGPPVAAEDRSQAPEAGSWGGCTAF
ncbi:hypothetical protein CRG98_002205 [Punica granatum]|uniref:CCHC-type domain-containing protein n=1 Tax=Punica granatum TaxID=22663 RepID=A0A2I0L9R6_PUNGR|nr:hypothetical protein CRG98_002205 [Punica granatum]